MTKLWGGRFTRDTDASVEEFTSSISFDQRLYRQDILGSMAHARMLGRCGIITQAETETIISGLASILADIEAGNFSFEIALEDIHMNIEKRLTERIGPVGGKLHTARSRNQGLRVAVRRQQTGRRHLRCRAPVPRRRELCGVAGQSVSARRVDVIRRPDRDRPAG